METLPSLWLKMIWECVRIKAGNTALIGSSTLFSRPRLRSGPEFKPPRAVVTGHGGRQYIISSYSRRLSDSVVSSQLDLDRKGFRLMPQVADPEEDQLWLFVPDLEVDMLRLKQSRESLVAGAQARNTAIGYAADWRDFAAWCASTARSPLPATADTLELYVTHALQVNKLRVTTVDRRVSAIRDAHRRAGLPLPAIAGVRQILTSVRQIRKESPEGKDPITAGELHKISVRLANAGGAIELRDRAVMVFGFTSALRISNLAALDLRDVTFDRKGLIVTIRSSKVDQFGVGAKIGIRRGRFDDTCPVKTLRAWLKVRGSQAGPLFAYVTRGGVVTNRRVRAAAIAEVVKRAVVLIGLDPSRFAGHTLRASCATAAYGIGSSDSAIMQRTGHVRVETMRKYFRDSDPFAGADPLAGVV